MSLSVTAARKSLTLLVEVQILAGQPTSCACGPIGRGTELKIQELSVQVAPCAPIYLPI
jgi:hypothetical protein